MIKSKINGARASENPNTGYSKILLFAPFGPYCFGTTIQIPRISSG
jgi:hypothetical protein